MNKKLFLVLFLALAAIQWYVPVGSIIQWEKVLAEGATYKFVTRPVDPTDLFRGKYMTLNFLNQSVTISEDDDYARESDVYLTLGIDSMGYAFPLEAFLSPPGDGTPYLTAKVEYKNSRKDKYHDESDLPADTTKATLLVSFPFDTYYLEESKASDAELAYREAVRDTAQVAYAVVKILNGKAVLQDVMINEKSILKVVEEIRKNPDKQTVAVPN